MVIETLSHKAAICASPSGEASPTQQRFAIDKCKELAAFVAQQTGSKGDGIHAVLST